MLAARQTTSLLLTRPLELSSGLETERVAYAEGHPAVLDAAARTVERTRNRARALPIVEGPHRVQVFHTQGKIFEDDNLIYKKELLKALHDLAFLPLHVRSLHPPMMLLDRLSFSLERRPRRSRCPDHTGFSQLHAPYLARQRCRWK